jgi:hypothetical protein
MLRASSPVVGECLYKAALAHEKAELADHKDTREFWVEMERKWLWLAESYASDQPYIGHGASGKPRRGEGTK